MFTFTDATIEQMVSDLQALMTALEAAALLGRLPDELTAAGRSAAGNLAEALRSAVAGGQA